MQGSTIESMSASTPPNDATPRTLAAAGLPRRVRKALEQALSLVSIELDNSLGTMLKEFEQELFRLADLARTPGVESSYMRSEEHTSELQSLMRISYAVFCLKKKKNTTTIKNT